MTFEHLQWLAAALGAVGTTFFGWWAANKKAAHDARLERDKAAREDRQAKVAEKKTLSEAEASFREELQTTVSQMATELDRMRKERDTDIERIRQERRADQRKCDKEIDEMREQIGVLSRTNARQQFELDQRAIQISELQRHKVVTFDLPGGRRGTDQVPQQQGPLGMPLPPNATFDFRVSNAPPGESTTVTPGITPGHSPG